MFPFPDPCPGTYGPGPLLLPEGRGYALWEYGLRSVGTFIDEANEHARDGIVYKSFACVGDVESWVDDCDMPTVKTPTDTLAGEENEVRGCPFHLYARLTCRTTTLADLEEDVREVYRLGEQKALENQVWIQVLATTSATLTNIDETTANAFSVVGGFSHLESAIAGCYGGRATIHAPRAVMAYAIRDRQVILVDGHYETPLGTKVAFYGGTPNTSPTGAGATAEYAWMYITPELTVRQFAPSILPPDAAHRLTYGAGMSNEPFILAERTYVPSTECCIYAAQVHLV